MFAVAKASLFQNIPKVVHSHHVDTQALPGKLTLHEADLLKKGSFDEVVKVGMHLRLYLTRV